MSKKMLERLRRVLSKFGELLPIVVRPHPSGEADRYQIVDGFHRWTVYGEQERDEIDVRIVDLDDAAAKKATVFLNETTGETEPDLLGRLLADLIQTDGVEVDELIHDLPYDESEIRLALDLAVHAWDPDNDKAGAGTTKGNSADWKMLRLRVPKDAEKVIRKALLHAADGIGKVPPEVRLGLGLERVAADYLSGVSVADEEPAGPTAAETEPAA